MLKYPYIILSAEAVKIRTLTAGKNDAGKRVDKFLTSALCDIPKSLLYKYFRKKCIKVNGARAYADTVLCEGDVLQLYISDEFFTSPDVGTSAPYKRPECTLKPQEIVYEDENIMIIDKPCGELVHSSLPDEDGGQDEICLVDRFVGYLYKKGEYRPENEKSFTPSLCNRLDRNTCGLVIAAKNAASLRIMNEKVKHREMVKLYHAAVYGVPDKKSAVLKDFFYKDRANNRVYIFSSKEQAKRELNIKYDDDIKTVITKYRVLKAEKDKALLEVELVTGRTHQIRAHLAYIGHPIIGDGKYGVNHSGKSGVKYQKLCSYSLKFAFKEPSGQLSYLDGMEFKSCQDFDLR